MNPTVSHQGTSWALPDGGWLTVRKAWYGRWDVTVLHPSRPTLHLARFGGRTAATRFAAVAAVR